RALKRLGRSEAAANALTRYLELAPNGEHRVAVEAELSVLQGEPATPTRPRPMPRVEATPTEAFDAETEASGRVYTWVFAAAALLFAGGAVGFYLDGAQRYDRLEAECGERGCSQSELGPLRTHLALGHVFLTGALLSLGAAAVSFFLEAPGDEPVAVSLGPLGASLRGRF
ncbi:MAG: hypothetical protein AAGF12_38160, partial [Myxococcota bacterium]